MPPSPVRDVSPPAWAANGSIAIPAGAGITLPKVQIGSDKPGRDTIVIVNIGANSCQLQSTQESQVTGVTLAAGGEWTLDVEGAVWITSTGGTTLDVVETWFPRDVGSDDRSLRPGTFAGQLHG